jgi:hypothetical protein
MDSTTAFDRRITTLDKAKDVPRGVVGNAVYVNDTLELAWLSAQAIFGDKATPEIALEIYDRYPGAREHKATTKITP